MTGLAEPDPAPVAKLKPDAPATSLIFDRPNLLPWRVSSGGRNVLLYCG